MDDKKLGRKIRTKLFVVTSILFLMTVFGLSYAYFTVQIRGNDQASSINIIAGRLSLIYTDVQIVMGEYEIPGWTDTKVLTVENDGTETVSYNIKWRELENTLTNDELVISATCTSNIQGNTCDDIPETVIPNAPTEITDVFVFGSVSIEPEEIHTYTVTVEFKEIGSVQNYNQNKYFNGTLNIGQGQAPIAMVRSGTDSTTGLPVVTYGTEEFYDITNAINYSSFDSTFKTKINYDSSKSVLLAKYNLYVGQNCTSSSSCTPISTSDSRYGLQSADAKGYRGNWDNPSVAVVPFSGSSNSYGYWDPSNTGINSTYGTYTNNTNNIYDINYIAAPNYGAEFYSDTNNVNYSIAYYVENYINTLGINGTGRLLTNTEADAMTQTQRTNGQYYWLGSAVSSYYVRTVRNSGYLSSYAFYIRGYNGVRPVIVVNTSDIQS